VLTVFQNTEVISTIDTDVHHSVLYGKICH